ncbi:hypothetical protein JQ604_11110 [Bradyrhizobium jicamae]|uniref:hypothetical protein n=1 Tax=Bradyrhizobium jicamae TaxID=280332 RepID=UPI001BAD9E3E|nr:hypothetical protein [Bradyrhizobium jicamae]MBR0752734.1 hypothetical protein [Bradyrhizobium jicamae]
MTVHRLYGELAASLVRGLVNCCELGAAPVRAGADLGGQGSQSAFEGACLVLWKLGLATLEDKLLIDGDQVVEFISDRSQAGHADLPPVDDVLAAWLLLFASQWDHASAKRLPFVPHDGIRPVMSALARLGYAEPLGHAFIWTDRIGPAMQMCGLWDQNNLSHEELDERDVDLEMRAAYASIPEDVRQAALRDDRIAVASALAERWIDGAWLPDSADGVPWWRLGDVGAQAKRLVELVAADARPMRDVN